MGLENGMGCREGSLVPPPMYYVYMTQVPVHIGILLYCTGVYNECGSRLIFSICGGMVL